MSTTDEHPVGEATSASFAAKAPVTRSHLSRDLAILLLATLAAAGATWLAAVLQTARYEASALLQVEDISTVTQVPTASAAQARTYLLNEASVVVSDDLVERTLAQLPDVEPDSVSFSAVASASRQEIRISVSANDPRTAVVVTDAHVGTYQNERIRRVDAAIAAIEEAQATQRQEIVDKVEALDSSADTPLRTIELEVQRDRLLALETRSDVLREQQAAVDSGTSVLRGPTAPQDPKGAGRIELAFSGAGLGFMSALAALWAFNQRERRLGNDDRVAIRRQRARSQ